MRTRRRRAWGKPYLPKGRHGTSTRWFWLKFKLPGDDRPRREPTEPRTQDEQEAWRQLHARLGELPIIRARRQHAEDMLVSDLLSLVVADYGRKGQQFPPGHLEAWMHTVGPERAVDIKRDHLEAICLHWQRVGIAWGAGTVQLPGAEPITWSERHPTRIRPVDEPTCNRYIATLRRAYRLGKEKRELLTSLTFPHYDERARGEYLTEDQCLAICTNYRAREGASVKADVFRLGYLLGVRKGQLRATCKRHVAIATGGSNQETWKLRWKAEDTKNGEAHEVVLVGESLEIVQRAWANRRTDCDRLFHVNGKPLGTMRSELRRTCTALGIPYGRGHGIVWHDTRHSAVTNLVGAGVPEVVAMTVTGHADANVFKRYNVRRDDVQTTALERMGEYLSGQRGAAVSSPRRPNKARQGTT